MILIYTTLLGLSGVGMETGYVLDDRRVEVGVPVGARIISSPCRPGWFWYPASFLSNKYRSSFSRVKVALA
jgi:hypothetical protein